MADTVNIERTCTHCSAVYTVTVSAKGFAAWDMGRGAHLQDAFPELTDNERELFLTGWCGPCFDALCPDPDDGPGFIAVLGAMDTGADTGATPDDRTSVPHPEANPGTSGVTFCAQHRPEMIEAARAGRTMEGDEVSRGFLSAPSINWPRCSTVLPGIESPLFLAEPMLCNRPATVLASFSDAYLNAARGHTCPEGSACPVWLLGHDAEVREVAAAQRIPVCGMHLAKLREDEDRFRTQIAPVDEVFALQVIGVESVIGHRAQVYDLRSTA
jgi:hypothetical protein